MWSAVLPRYNQEILEWLSQPEDIWEDLGDWGEEERGIIIKEGRGSSLFSGLTMDLHFFSPHLCTYSYKCVHLISAIIFFPLSLTRDFTAFIDTFCWSLDTAKMFNVLFYVVKHTDISSKTKKRKLQNTFIDMENISNIWFTNNYRFFKKYRSIGRHLQIYASIYFYRLITFIVRI